MQPDASLLALLKHWGIESKASTLPVETVRDLQLVFVTFDRADVPAYLDLPSEKVDLIFNHFQQEKKDNESTYDLQKLVDMASLDPHVIRDWNKRQLYLFGVSDFTPEMKQMFPSESSLKDLRRACLAWAQKKFDEDLL